MLLRCLVKRVEHVALIAQMIRVHLASWEELRPRVVNLLLASILCRHSRRTFALACTTTSIDLVMHPGALLIRCARDDLFQEASR